MMFVGVDPGASGAVVTVDESGKPVGLLVLKKATLREVVQFMEDVGDAFAMIEKVHSMPGQGVASSFKFGESYGELRASLVAARIPFERVTPVAWQRAMRCLSKGDKNVTKRRASELFPELKITHAIADALLIAEYARRTYAARKVTA